MGILQIRKTHGYRDGWSYLDEWEDIGTYEIEARGEKDYDPDSYEDAFSQVLMVRVESDASLDDIRRALQAAFSGSHCQHEYDCCGCYSYYATATPLTRDSEAKASGTEASYWRVVYSGSRNY